ERRPLALILACVLTTVLPVRTLAQHEPELPRVFVDTTYSPPTRGKLIRVKAGGDLQAALHASQPGDVIELQAGATFTGNFILPKKPGTDWIYIRSSAHALLPHPGTRVSPSHARLMPRIDSPNRAPAIRTAAAAHHYRFVGIEVTARGETRSTGPYSDNNVVYLESEGGQTAPTQVPTDIIFDRCYVHGTPTGGVRRGIAMNGTRLAVVDSYLSDFHEVGADSQAISGWNGPGPFKIVNNYLEGAGENLMFGGADPSIPDLVPSDIEIRGNHLFKPLSWKIGHPTYAGRPWSVKNIFELKNARRVLAEGNLLEHNWQHDQNGFAILFTVRNQDGGAPWCAVEDVTFRKNVVRHSGGGFNILAADNNFPSQQTRRILIQDNLLDDISSVNWGGTGRLFQFLSLDTRDTGILELTVEHNTGFSNAWSAYTGDKPVAVHRSFTFRNNIAGKTTHGFTGGTKSWPAPSPLVTGDGSQTLNTFYLAPVFAGNVLVGSTPADYSGYPGNFFPATDAEVGFVDLSHGNYRLGPSSPYKNAGTDGKDPGAAIDALEAATAGAVSGDWNFRPRSTGRE
ncbi:MAG TPA: hypothetical protein VFS78_21400, partial [Vicinamibacteria bacterium]|nr:hypothetical protein [Vicinamibacteria bacterium]